VNDDSRPRPKGARYVLLLLIIPFIGLLWPAWYSSVDPQFAGIPFFYWYQFLWVFIAAAMTALVYWLDREAE